MLPDDDMLKAFVADTLMKEDEQAPSHASAVRASEKRPIVNAPKAIEAIVSSRLPGTKPVLGSILKWGLLILAVIIAWFVLSKE